MAYIYKISNTINSKVYIGKTLSTIEKRWKEHCRSYTRNTCENRPLYRAFNKHGVENFSIEQIEECSENILSEREIYWIKYYNSYEEGYNATLGGDGKTYIDSDLVITTYYELKNMREVARVLKISQDSVSDILHRNNIETISSAEVCKLLSGKKVDMFTKKDEYVQTFLTMCDAGRFLIENNLTVTTDVTKLSDKISKACRGLAKTSYGYVWKFHED